MAFNKPASSERPAITRRTIFYAREYYAAGQASRPTTGSDANRPAPRARAGPTSAGAPASPTKRPIARNTSVRSAAIAANSQAALAPRPDATDADTLAGAQGYDESTMAMDLHI